VTPGPTPEPATEPTGTPPRTGLGWLWLGVLLVAAPAGGLARLPHAVGTMFAPPGTAAAETELRLFTPSPLAVGATLIGAAVAGRRRGRTGSATALVGIGPVPPLAAPALLRG